MENETTKKCSCCGNELPVSEFQTDRQGNPISVCKSCMSKKRVEGHERRKAERKNEAEAQIQALKTARLSQFTPRELMTELKRRGFEFQMKFTETVVRTISSADL